MSALSERRLISFLEARFHEVAPGVGLGIGDDAAVLRAGGAEPWVVSVDASVEGVHFDLAYLDYADIGYRSFQAAASDLAAMGATPAGALSALILPKTMSADAIDALTAGQAAASREAGCPVIGGNVSRGRELSVTTTVLGRAQRPLTRAGARPGDVFGPEVSQRIREIVKVDFQGTFGQSEKAAVKDQAPPASEVRLELNAKYPEDLALTTMPPNLLFKLPRLPEGVDYRFVGRHFILRAVDANIIVDYVENAAPQL